MHSIFLELCQRKDFESLLLQATSAAVRGQFDDEGAFENFSACPPQQGACGFAGAAGGEQVVDEQDAFTGRNRIDVDFDASRIEFRFVVLPDGFKGQLARRVERHETCAQGVGKRRADDETTRLDCSNLMDFLAAVAVDQLVHGNAEARGVFEQGRDVAEYDTLPGEIRNGADS